MATSVEEVRAVEASFEEEAIRNSAREMLVAYSKKTAIYFAPEWEQWCVLLREELEKRTNALIDAEVESEKAKLQGMCHTLRWILKQKSVAESEIHRLRVEMSDLPAAGDRA